jgi:hypothetical protein
MNVVDVPVWYTRLRPIIPVSRCGTANAKRDQAVRIILNMGRLSFFE